MTSFTTERFKRALIVGAAGCALMGAVTPAFAQETDAAVLDEIVVTAQKRTENIQDVPISMNVVTGVQLERQGATQLQDFAGYVPGFSAPSFGTPGQNQLIMRGITSGERSSTTVGTYVDDIPVGSSTSYQQAGRFTLDLMPYDIRSVEILKGPQGTLYGASTMGGLIKYVTVDPDLDHFEARVGAGVSTTAKAGDPSWGVRAGINAPLVEGRLALRASVFSETTAGYLDNPVRGETDVNEVRQTGGRLAILWKPTDDLSIKLAAMTQKVEADARSDVALIGGVPVFGQYDRVNVLPEAYEQRADLFTATVNWDLGFASLTSASSYSKTRTSNPADTTPAIAPYFPLLGVFFPGFPAAGYVPTSVDLKLEKYTQELRLASNGEGRLQWLVGAFYTYEKGENRQVQGLLDLNFDPVPVYDPLVVAELPSTYREFAVFANATWKVTDAFDISAGVRWAQNRQKFSTVVDGLLAGLLLPPAGTYPGRSSEDVTTFSVSPQLHISDDVMLYARVATGYRPGGPNVPLGGLPPTFEADTLTNWELGLKSEFWDRRALVNLSLFRIDWKDIQINVASGIASGLDNGGKAISQGAELTTLFRPVQGLSLGFNAAYTDATLSEDVPALGGFDGDRLPYVARWQTSATVDYVFPAFGDWEGAVGAGWRWTGDRNTEFPGMRLDSYSAVDLNASLSNDRWTVRLFAKNLFDERAYLSGVDLGPFTYAALLKPRTIGLSFDAKF